MVSSSAYGFCFLFVYVWQNVTKNGNSAKMVLMAFKGKELRNSCIFVNAVFYETLQVLIFAYLRVLWYFWHDFFVKISERSTLA